MIEKRSECSLLEISSLRNDISGKILQGVFDRRDLQPQTKFGFERLLAKERMDIKGPTYTQIATSLLKQLTQDMYVSIDLFEYDDWDRCILQDALKLLGYTLDNLFGGIRGGTVAMTGLGVAYNACKDNTMHESKKAADAFLTQRKEAYTAYLALVNHLKLEEPLSDDFKARPDDKISTATFLELLFRNEAQKPMDPKYRNTMSGFSEISSRVFRSYSVINLKQKGAPKDISWHPATIAIVRDSTTGLVFTGATKAQVNKLKLLQRAAYDITVMRLGQKFRGEIDKSNQLFQSRLKYEDSNNGRPPHWFKQLSNPGDTVLKDLHDIPIFQISNTTDASPSSGVVSLSISTRQTAENEPCTRCQCFYHRWKLNLRPTTPEHRWMLFQREMGNFKATQFEKASYGFNYCAETVAAAQLFSLYTGNISSNVQDD